MSDIVHRLNEEDSLRVSIKFEEIVDLWLMKCTVQIGNVSFKFEINYFSS